MSVEYQREKLKNEYEYLQAKKGIRKSEFPLAFSHGYTMYLESCLLTEREKNRQLTELLKDKQNGN